MQVEGKQWSAGTTIICTLPTSYSSNRTNYLLQAIQVLLADPDVGGLEVCGKDLSAQKDIDTYSELQVLQYHLCTELCKTQDSKNSTEESIKILIVQVLVRAKRLHFRRFRLQESSLYFYWQFLTFGIIVIVIIIKNITLRSIITLAALQSIDDLNSQPKLCELCRMASGRPYNPCSEIPWW